MFKITGKMSTFGGPKDFGMAPNEGLALFEAKDLEDRRHRALFLATQPAGTSGMGRRLDPEQNYFAARFDYRETPKEMLRGALFKVTANGFTEHARAADWGPNERTGRVADLSPGLARRLRLETDDTVTIELVTEAGEPAAEPETSPAPVPEVPEGAGRPSLFMVGADNWLAGVPRSVIPGGNPFAVLRCLVIHFTAGATGESSIDYWKSRGDGVCAHLVIERDGKVTQCRDFARTCGHAGESRWRDPRTGNLYLGCNSFSLGIEIANAGDDDAALKWARKQPGFQSVRAKHRNGGPEQEWESFYPAQLTAVFGIARLLVEHYRLADVTGHDCIAPERKNDPGPAFPMEQLRENCGFAGLPAVHKKP